VSRYFVETKGTRLEDIEIGAKAAGTVG
jgi:hypothetical protein